MLLELLVQVVLRRELSRVLQQREPFEQYVSGSGGKRCGLAPQVAAGSEKGVYCW